MNKAWGWSLLVNAAGCNEKIKDKDAIIAFSNDLVEKIDMIPYGEPQVVHFGSDDKTGFTLVQLIETSNITAHFSEDTSCMYLDVFSCKEFDQKIVQDVVKEHFGSEYMTVTFVERYVSLDFYDMMNR